MRRLVQAILIEAGLRLADRILNGKLDRPAEERRRDIEDAVARRVQELREEKRHVRRN